MFFRGHRIDSRWGAGYNNYQVEAAVGLGVGVRVGFNVAEMLDFILGWASVDICHDDIESVPKSKRAAYVFNASPNGGR